MNDEEEHEPITNVDGNPDPMNDKEEQESLNDEEEQGSPEENNAQEQEEVTESTAQEIQKNKKKTQNHPHKETHGMRKMHNRKMMQKKNTKCAAKAPRCTSYKTVCNILYIGMLSKGIIQKLTY